MALCCKWDARSRGGPLRALPETFGGCRQRKKAPVVLQDNASIHNSNFAHVYIKHHGLKFINGHPSIICDLNPAELMCARLKVVAFHGPSTRESLVRTIAKTHHIVPQSTIDTCIAHFGSG